MALGDHLNIQIHACLGGKSMQEDIRRLEFTDFRCRAGTQLEVSGVQQTFSARFHKRHGASQNMASREQGQTESTSRRSEFAGRDAIHAPGLSELGRVFF